MGSTLTSSLITFLASFGLLSWTSNYTWNGSPSKIDSLLSVLYCILNGIKKNPAFPGDLITSTVVIFFPGANGCNTPSPLISPDPINETPLGHSILPGFLTSIVL